jgi:hypothetical protein
MNSKQSINFNVADDSLEYAKHNFSVIIRIKQALWHHGYCVGGNNLAKLSLVRLTIPENQFPIEEAVV